MEQTYKISIKTEQDVRSLFPSERRYSASTVLGISIVFVALTVTAVLMGSLTIHKVNKFNQEAGNITIVQEYIDVSINSSERYEELDEEVINDSNISNDTQTKTDHRDMTSYLATSAFLLGLGTIVASVTGFLAWKKWYIDYYIIVFFLGCTFSLITSSVSLVLIVFTFINTNHFGNFGTTSKVNMYCHSIGVNTAICVILTLIWSILSTKISYSGMVTNYPDDVNGSKQGNHVEVKTKVKGNKSSYIVPPDLVNNIPFTGKMAKFFQKKDSKTLPKSESNCEYQERVNKFLSDLTEIAQSQKVQPST